MKNRRGFTLETTDALNIKILDCGLEINLGITTYLLTQK